jgi:hypothetical protein
MNQRRTHPLIPGVSFYLAAVILLFGSWHLLRAILAMTDGHLVYGLDDPYIHLSIARSLVEHGVYGVTPDAAGFASSSVLWPLLLAGVSAVTGGLLMLPLIFNVLAAIGSLWIIEAMGKREGLSASGRFMLTFFFIIVTPVQPLIFMGMEHALHLSSVLVVLYAFLGLKEGTARTRGQEWFLYISISASVLIRYETLFLAIALAALLAYRRQFRGTVLLLLSAVLPVVITGMIMIASGGYFLSNSLLVKGPAMTADDVIRLHNFLYYYLLWPDTQAVHWRLVSMSILAIGVLFVLPKEGRSRIFRQLLYALLAAIAIHILVVRFDHFNRYTAYMVGSGMTVILLSFLSSLRQLGEKRATASLQWTTVPLILIAVITIVPLLMAGMSLNRNVPSLSRNIYEQQYQTGRFLSRYYTGETVAINDLGLVVYDGHIQPLDLAGLADRRIAIAKRNRVFNTDSIRLIAGERGTEIAILYRSWFHDDFALPKEWIPVEEWVLQDNIICGSDTLNFYGVTPAAADTLRQRLQRFHPRLPKRVIVREIPAI